MYAAPTAPTAPTASPTDSATAAPTRRSPRFAQAAGHAPATIALAGFTVGALAMLALWWFDTPAGIGPGWSGAFTALGQITGLVGGYFLLVEVALIARTPWMEQRVGTDRVTRWHRGLGEYTVILLVSHMVLLIAGASLRADEPVLTAATTMIFDLPEVLPATIATGLLIGIGVLSATAIRRKLRYETWHATHLLGYLSLLLAFNHQITIGSSFTTPAISTGWTALHLVVGAAALWWRVLTPMWLYWRHRPRVAAVVGEGPRTVSIIITGHRMSDLAAQPGQFFRFRFLTRNRWWQAHPYSLSAAPTRDGLRITVKALGDHSAGLATLRPGTAVLIEGPYGSITPNRFGQRHLVLIGGGVGITPLRALLDSVPPSPAGQRPNATLIQRANSHDELLFRTELAALAATNTVAVHAVVGPQQRVRFDAARLRGLVPDIADCDVVLCGPPGMVDATLAALDEAKVPSKHIHVERFAF